MERKKRILYSKNPNYTVAFNYRVCTLSTDENYCKENVKEY